MGIRSALFCCFDPQGRASGCVSEPRTLASLKCWTEKLRVGFRQGVPKNSAGSNQNQNLHAIYGIDQPEMRRRLACVGLGCKEGEGVNFHDPTEGRAPGTWCPGDPGRLQLQREEPQACRGTTLAHQGPKYSSLVGFSIVNVLDGLGYGPCWLAGRATRGAWKIFPCNLGVRCSPRARISFHVQVRGLAFGQRVQAPNTGGF